MNHKRALIPATIAITIGAFASPASAHIASATATCQGLTWSVIHFDKLVVNTITVTVDGGVVHNDPDFKSSDEGTHPWDSTTAHTWAVAVDAPGVQWDRSFAGTQVACVAPTTTVPMTTPTVPATTTTTLNATTTTLNTVPDGTTTTTSVFPVGPPPVPTTVATDVVVLIPEPVLPRTGLDGGEMLAIAACLLLCGGFLLYVRRVAR